MNRVKPGRGLSLAQRRWNKKHRRPPRSKEVRHQVTEYLRAHPELRCLPARDVIDALRGAGFVGEKTGYLDCLSVPKLMRDAWNGAPL
jgi:hypothetical protein